MTASVDQASRDVRSVPLLIALCVATFGFYVFYWFNRTWERLSAMGYVRGSAHTRTVVFLLPLVNIVLVYELFKGIHNAAVDRGLPTFSTPGRLTLLSVALSGLSITVAFLPLILALTEGRAPHVHTIISNIPRAGRLATVVIGAASAALVPAVSQATLNAVFAEGSAMVRHVFSPAEAVILAIGAVLWLSHLL